MASASRQLPGRKAFRTAPCTARQNSWGVKTLATGFGKSRLWHLCISATGCHLCQTLDSGLGRFDDDMRLSNPSHLGAPALVMMTGTPLVELGGLSGLQLVRVGGLDGDLRAEISRPKFCRTLCRTLDYKK